MTDALATYRQVQRGERPIVEVLIDACLQSVDEAQRELRIKGRELQLMACHLFDIWWDKL